MSVLFHVKPFKFNSLFYYARLRMRYINECMWLIGGTFSVAYELWQDVLWLLT